VPGIPDGSGFADERPENNSGGREWGPLLIDFELSWNAPSFRTCHRPSVAGS